MQLQASVAENASGLPAAVLNIAFVAVVILALLPFGSVDPTPFAFVASAVFLLSIASIAFLGIPRRTQPLFARALILLAVLSAWAVVQTLDLSWTGLANPVWRDINPLAGHEGASISIAPADTLFSMLQVAAPFMGLLTGLILCPTDEHAERMLRRLALAGGLIALFGLLQHLAFPGTLLLMEKRHYLDSLTTVFVNRNTAATFLGLVSILLTGLVWQSLRDGAPRALRAWLANRPHPARMRMLPFLWSVSLLCVTVTALLLTKSRAGIASTLAAFLFLTPFLAVELNKARNPGGLRRPAHGMRRALAAIGAMLAVLLFGYLLAGRALMRAEAAGTEDARFCIYPSLLSAIESNWLTGTGFGTFLHAFPAYRPTDCSLWGIWDRAHDVYLEGMLGMGIIFLPAIGYAIYQLSAALFAGLRQRRSARVYPAMGIAALILVALHSILDFSLQIPGFSLFFAASLAPILSISLGRNSK